MCCNYGDYNNGIIDIDASAEALGTVARDVRLYPKTWPGRRSAICIFTICAYKFVLVASKMLTYQLQDKIDRIVNAKILQYKLHFYVKFVN